MTKPNIKTKQFKQITLEDRLLIEHLSNKQNKNMTEIAEEIGKDIELSKYTDDGVLISTRKDLICGNYRSSKKKYKSEKAIMTLSKERKVEMK